MIIDCISDLHGYYPKLEGGDLLIVAGDLTARDTYKEYIEFNSWLLKQKYTKKILIAGNHDNWIEKNPITKDTFYDCDYLCDSGTELVYYPPLDPMEEGKVYERKTLKIWGSPWTLKFPGMNPHCMAFTCDTEEELAEKWMLIPKETNILITHSPSFGNYDWVKNNDGTSGQSVGSPLLWMWMLTMTPHLKLHVTGHIHEAYGNSKHANGIHLVNASHVNEHYQPVNNPVRVVL